MSVRAAGPFSARAGMFLVLAGIALFVFALWAMGNAMDKVPDQTAGASGRGHSFEGFAALGSFLGKRGYKVDAVESDDQLRQGGLLVISPPHRIRAAELEKMVAAHRSAGPTMVIMPKWQASGPPQLIREGKHKGEMVEPLDPHSPLWPGWHDEISLDLYPMRDGPRPGGWQGLGVQGQVPNAEGVISARGEGLVPLVTDSFTGRILAGYLADGGNYPALRAESASPEPSLDGERVIGRYPLILVFEPDLLNNYGFSRIESSRLAEKLVQAALDGEEKRVMFDLSMNGYARQQSSRNLLQEAFKPPFLAATICLLLAAMVAFWRALHRFGPPLLAARSIAFGKRALLANGAGLVQRARRLHLLGAPYADAARERLTRALALPAQLDPAAAEMAIDRALAFRAPHAVPFSAAAAQMRGARRPVELLRAARLIHSLERTLKR